MHNSKSRRANHPASDSDVINQVLKVNYYGALSISQALLQHLRQGGRLVNIASLLGKISQYPPHLQTALRDAASQSTPDASTKLMQSFAKSVADNTIEKTGWPRSAYSVSKAGCIAMTKALANGEKQKESAVLVNTCCPGYIKTDLTKNRGFGTPDQGAQTPVLLALGDIKGSSGDFWKDGRVVEW
jgi:carbonyl reductase 1